MRFTVSSILLASILLVPVPSFAKVIIEETIVVPASTVYSEPATVYIEPVVVVPESTVILPASTVVRTRILPTALGARYYEDTREWRPALFKWNRHEQVRHEISAFEAQRHMDEDPDFHPIIEYR